MKIISHRGNYSGINPEKENKPSYIDTAISMGYEVEVDIRYFNKKFYLGHDEPEILVTEKWIEIRKDYIWFHCKDLYSAQQFKKMDSNIKYFCHSKEEFVLTSTNHIWVHNLNLELDETCIIPLLDKDSILNHKNLNVFGICSDFVNICKSIWN